MLSPSSVWFITGATSGFGKRFTLSALSRGDRVIATGKSLDKLQAMVSSLKPVYAERVRVEQLDVTAGEEQVKNVVDQAAKHWGGIDVLINNAGIGYHGLMEEGGSKLLRRQFEANVFGVADVSFATIPYLRRSSNGRLVVIGSRSAWKAERLGLGPYSASKAAVGAFTENLMSELAPFNVKVLLVLPGAFRTEGIYGQKFFQDNPMPIHDEARTTVIKRIAEISGNEPGDPDKGAEVVVDVIQGRGAAKDRPWPSYLCLGEDAQMDVTDKCETVLRSLRQWREEGLMPSEFVNHFTRSLAVSTSRPPSPPPTPRLNSERQAGASGYRAFKKSTLHELLLKLNQASISPPDVQIAVCKLRDIVPPVGISGSTAIRVDDADAEETSLEEAVIGKLTVALYSDALDTCLAQATQAESEAQWWADIEHSQLGVLLYFLQTLPQRFSSAAATIVDTLRQRRMPINLTTLSPSSIRSLFSTPRFSIRPSALTIACFPHLKNQQSLSTAALFSPPRGSAFGGEGIQSAWSTLITRIVDFRIRVMRLASLPLELTRQECKHNRKALERIRDQRAEVIGQLAQLRTPLSDLMDGTNSGVRVNGLTQPSKKYASFVDTLLRVVAPSPPSYDFSGSESPLEPLDGLSTSLMALRTSHIELLKKQRLLRPSPLTRCWPSLLVLPPLSLYVYSNYTHWIPATTQMFRDAKDTLRGFVDGWLVEPLVSVLRTVRAGGGGDVLVHAEGVAADLESLERMTLSLARDSLNYTPDQLQALSEKVRLGDLTPVMQAYEVDIRTPLRSAVSGNLLRTVLIQVQKAKVDIDQALSGIDKLLKSQELTFAFVGVAPALTVVYVLGGFLGQVWSGTIGKGRWGGKRRRRGVWEGLRRVERLLIRQLPSSEASSSESSSPMSSSESVSAPLPPLPTGLVILSMTQLRSYALQHLPTDIQVPFLEDLADLEDPTLGRQAKLKVVERMWRCWGNAGTGIVRF